MERGHPPSRWIARIVIGLAGASLVAGWAGDLLLAAIVDNNPLALIALNPRNRNLALAAPQIDAIPYYTVGFIRLVASDPLNFLLGYWYGDRALAWVKRRSRTYGPFVDNASEGFKKYALPLIFAAPNNIICMLAGATGIRIRTFVALNVTGTIARLYLVRQFGEAFSGEVTSVVDWIGRYRTPILIISAIGVAWTIFGEFRGDNSELKSLIDLEKDPEAESSSAASSDETTSSDGPEGDQSTSIDRS